MRGRRAVSCDAEKNTTTRRSARSLGSSSGASVQSSPLLLLLLLLIRLPSASSSSPLSLAAQGVCKHCARTGWGTTALCKLPYSNLQARPLLPPSPPPPLRSPSSSLPPRGRITPAGPASQSAAGGVRAREWYHGRPMAEEPWLNLVPAPFLIGAFNSQRLVADWPVIYSMYIRRWWLRLWSLSLVGGVFRHRQRMWAETVSQSCSVEKTSASLSPSLLCVCLCVSVLCNFVTSSTCDTAVS